MEDLRHDFISLDFENDLAMKNPMVSSNLYVLHNVGKTCLH